MHLLSQLPVLPHCRRAMTYLSLQPLAARFSHQAQDMGARTHILARPGVRARGGASTRLLPPISGTWGVSAGQRVSVSVNSEYLGAECMTQGAGETWRQKSSDQGQAGDFCGSLTSHRKSFPSQGSQPPTRVFHLGWTYRDGKQVQAQGLQQQVNALKGKSFLL